MPKGLQMSTRRWVAAKPNRIASIERCDARCLLAVVAGAVFADSDRDGRLDPGEPGIAGRTVFADYNYNGRLDTGDVSTTTDATGAYQLLSVRTAGVQIGVVVGNGETLSLPYGASLLWISDIPASGATGKNLGIASSSAAPAVAGTIFSDANQNGRLDAGETGLPSRTVFADYNFNGALDVGEPSALTDASGNYVLPTRSQFVQLSLVTRPGEQITLGYGATSIWIAAVNGSVTGKNIGVRMAEPTRVDLSFFPDYNNNGRRDANELGSLDDYADENFYGWLDLDGNNTQNESAGEWSIPYESQIGGWHSFFVELQPGNYRFQIRTYSSQSTLSSGSAITIVVGGSPSTYEIGVTGVAPVDATLFYDRNGNGEWDFQNGETGFPEFDPFWSTHNIFMDRNGDGIQQAGEPSFFESHYTGSHPSWAYFGVYTVTGLLPGEVFTTSHTFVVGPAPVGTTYIGIGGDVRNAIVSGTVFRDTNRNGQIGAGEPGLASRTVFADYNYNGILDTNEPRAFTDAEGNYSLFTRSQHIQLTLVTNPGEQITLGYGATSIWIPSIDGSTGGRNFGIA